jgi:hypothetical protein
MLALPTVPRNAARTQSEGRARQGCTKRGKGQYKGRSPKAATLDVVREFYWALWFAKRYPRSDDTARPR